jgi:hypothetical protein
VLRNETLQTKAPEECLQGLLLFYLFTFVTTQGKTLRERFLSLFLYTDLTDYTGKHGFLKGFFRENP